MNTNETIQEALKVSVAVKDSVLSSISWSGASRVVNAIVAGDKPEALDESMAKMASKVSVDRIRPSTDDVLSLMLTAPEKQELTTTQLDLLQEAGEELQNVQQVIEHEFAMSLERHERQKRLILAFEDDIRAKLDKLFSVKTAKLPDFPEMEDIKARVISKVANRKPRLIADLSYGRVTAEQLKNEIANINAFMAKAA